MMIMMTPLLQPYATTSTGCRSSSVYLTSSAPAVFLSLPALGASTYIQHHVVIWLYHAPARQSVDQFLRSLIRPFGTVYHRLFASRQR